MDLNGAMTPGSPALQSSIAAPPPGQCPYLGASSNQQTLLTGTLDEVRVYTRALTGAEIDELYRISQ